MQNKSTYSWQNASSLWLLNIPFWPSPLHSHSSSPLTLSESLLPLPPCSDGTSLSQQSQNISDYAHSVYIWMSPVYILYIFLHIPLESLSDLWHAYICTFYAKLCSPRMPGIHSASCFAYAVHQMCTLHTWCVSVTDF